MKGIVKASKTCFLFAFLLITIFSVNGFAIDLQDESHGKLAKLETESDEKIITAQVDFASSFKEVLSDELTGLCGFKTGLTSGNPDDWTCDGQSYDPATYCTWTGITCKDPTNGPVTSINLFGKNLAGTISPLIGKLTHLEVLSLSSNSLGGMLPTALGSLVNLVSFDASYNKFSGVLPTQIALMASLTFIHCHSCNLKGALPTQLGLMSNLLSLSLPSNQFNGQLPAALGLLAKLTYLHLYVNSFTGTIPRVIWKLTDLDSLELSYNSFSDVIPPDIGQLQKLTDLGLDVNKLHGKLPSEIGTMTNLVSMWLYNNTFTGIIPYSFCSLSKMMFFDVQYTNLKCYPDCFDPSARGKGAPQFKPDTRMGVCPGPTNEPTSPTVEPSVSPTLAPTAAQTISASSTLLTSKFALELTGVSASEFGPVEQSAFKSTVAETTNACATCVDIDSVGDVPDIAGPSRRLSAEAQQGGKTKLKVAFHITIPVVAGAGDTVVKTAFSNVNSALTTSLTTGAFVDKLKTIATANGAISLTFATADTSGLTNYGYARSLTTAQPVVASSSKGKKDKKKDDKQKDDKKMTKAPKIVKTKTPVGTDSKPGKAKGKGGDSKPGKTPKSTSAKQPKASAGAKDKGAGTGAVKKAGKA